MSFTPSEAAVGDEITVSGTNWLTDDELILYLVPESQWEDWGEALWDGDLFVLSRVLADESGLFSTDLAIPPEVSSEDEREALLVTPGQYRVGVRGGNTVQATGVLTITD